MIEAKDRLPTAQWVLERNLGWISSAEVKVAFVVALQTAMLGGLAAAFGAATTKTAWAILWASVSFGLGIIGLLICGISVLPRIDGPKESLLYFRRIGALDEATYAERFRKATPEQLLEDWSAQIYQNACIALRKHTLVRRALGCLFGSAVTWLPAIAVLTKF